MDAEVRHYYVDVDGIRVRIDEIFPSGLVGFGYRIGDRAYVGHAKTVAAAKRAAPKHVRATLRKIEKAKEAIKAREREMRTIRSW